MLYWIICDRRITIILFQWITLTIITYYVNDTLQNIKIYVFDLTVFNIINFIYHLTCDNEGILIFLFNRITLVKINQFNLFGGYTS